MWSGKPGKQLTNLTVTENTWEVREQGKSPGKILCCPGKFFQFCDLPNKIGTGHTHGKKIKQKKPPDDSG